jgi:hypothetical protein
MAASISVTAVSVIFMNLQVQRKQAKRFGRIVVAHSCTVVLQLGCLQFAFKHRTVLRQKSFI